MMIPKIIHYCWFGNNSLPPLALECIESWKKYCPDYEIQEWNESNFDFNMTTYTKEAAKAGYWAFVSDVARLYAVYHFGGVYFDVDVEVLKPIDRFLENDMFIGFQTKNEITTGLGFGAIKNFGLVKRMLDIYDDFTFINQDKTFNTVPCPVYVSEIMKLEGFNLNNTIQIRDNISVYSTEYFCPEDFMTGVANITNNTYTYHHFLASWWSDEEKRQHKIKKKLLAYKRINEALENDQR